MVKEKKKNSTKKEITIKIKQAKHIKIKNLIKMTKMNGTKLKKNKEKEIPDLFNIISDFQYLIITIY